MPDRLPPVVAILALAFPLAAQDHVRPPVFADLGFAAAAARAEQQGKLLILDAMTSWCGPCKVMDRTTWVDPGLVAWIGEHAVAVQLDMDVHTDVKDRFAIRAFPTVVVLRDGVVFDKVVGLRDAAFMRSWLEGAVAGRNGADQARAALAELRAAGPVAAHFAARVGQFDRLVETTAFDDALAEGLELWAVPRSGIDASALRTLEGGLGQLARSHPAARDALVARRDDLTPPVDRGGASVDREVLRRWIALNAILGETDRTAAWATRVAEGDAGAALLRETGGELFPTLIGRGAWRAAGLSLVDPVGRVRDRRVGVVAVAARSASVGDGGPAAAGSVPAIPLAPRPVVDAGEAAAPKVTPAIPMAPRQPAAADEAAAPQVIPAIPLAPRPAVDAGGAAAPKVTPAIPMAPRQPAAADEAAAPQVIPAIPLAPRSATGADPVEAPLAVDPDEPTWTNPPDQEALAREVAARIRYAFRQDCADVYAALCAAGRVDEAGAVAALLLEVDGSVRARAALVGRALQAGAIDVRRAAHQCWLDQAGR